MAYCPQKDAKAASQIRIATQSDLDNEVKEVLAAIGKAKRKPKGEGDDVDNGKLK